MGKIKTAGVVGGDRRKFRVKADACILCRVLPEYNIHTIHMSQVVDCCRLFVALTRALQHDTCAVSTILWLHLR